MKFALIGSAGFSVAIAFVCACTPDRLELAGSVSCVQNSVLHTCNCNAYFITSSDPADEVVNSCDAPPVGVVWDCIIESDSQGLATDCACSVSTCFEPDTSTCTCEFVVNANALESSTTSMEAGIVGDEEGSTTATVVATYPIVPDCTAPAGHCCNDTTKSTCTCSAATCASGIAETPSCAPPTPVHASSCAGLNWEGE